MRMFDIVELGNWDNNSGMSRTASSVDTALAETAGERSAEKYKIYFKLETPLASDNDAHVYQKYLDNGKFKKLYFKTY